MQSFLMDLVFWGGMIAIWLAVTLTKRSVQLDQIKPDEIGPASWGLYSQDKNNRRVFLGYYIASWS